MNSETSNRVEQRLLIPGLKTGNPGIMKSKKTKAESSVYFIAPAPLGISPGQRFRFEMYLAFLQENGVSYKVSSYLSMNGRKALYTNSNTFRKILAVCSGYTRRIGDLFKLLGYEYVYIHRESSPMGPAFFEWVVSKILRKKIIYDFDDAIWVPAMSDYNRNFAFIKFFGKVKKICKWAHVVTVGNPYLGDWAKNFNDDVRVIPTVVDTEAGHNKMQNHRIDRPAVGWTGSFSTLAYLDLVLPALQELQEEIDFDFYVIADRDPKLSLKNYKFIKWKKESEAEDLLNFHVGLMPLTDDEYSRGKCGFKAIQYMATGIPAIVSPVGVNVEIVSDGKDGFTCVSEEDWKNKIRVLLKDAEMRERLGRAAREKIEEKYSVISTEHNFINLFTGKAAKSLAALSGFFLTLL